MTLNKSDRSQKSKKKSAFNWKKCEFQSKTDEANNVHKSHNPSILNKWSDENITPGNVFKCMWDETIMDEIKQETNRYHLQKYGKELNATTEELCKLFEILLLSGYNPVSKNSSYV